MSPETLPVRPPTPPSSGTASSANFGMPDDVHQRRRSTQPSIASLQHPNTSVSNLPNAIDLSEQDEDDNRADIERIRTETLSRSPSFASHVSVATPVTSRTRVRRETPRNSIFTLTSQLSRPPSYKRFDPLEHEFPDNVAREGSHIGGWNGLVAQFSGIYFAFWLVTLAFLGAISIIVPGIPRIALLLWIPLVLYLSFSVYFFRQRRTKMREHGDQASFVERGRRESRVRELLRAMRLPESYFFVISNQKEHSHPVVTLLPPPPTYNTDGEVMVNAIPDTEHPNSHPDDEDFVRINLDRLVEAEHREERHNSQA